MAANPEYGLYGQATVRLRLDDQKPFVQRWSESTDNKALFAPNGAASATQLTKAERLLFEFTPFQSGATTVTFDVRGLDKLLDKVTGACKGKSRR